MTAVLAIVLLIPAAMIVAAVRRVPEGEAWTVRRFGSYVRTLRPGIHLVWPLLDRIARHVALTGHHVELSTRAFGADSASADLYYQILDPIPSRDGLETLDDMVRSQADDALTSVSARLPQQTGWTSTTADALKVELNHRLGGMGLRVIRCALHTA